MGSSVRPHPAGLLGRAIIPFLGAGASLDPRVPRAPDCTAPPPVCTYLPNGTELTEHLATWFGPPLQNRKIWQRSRNTFTSKPDGHLFTEPCTQSSAIHATQPVHRFLASSSKPLLVVTTNYGTLIEKAFEGINILD
jgi:hypothetical protein